MRNPFNLVQIFRDWRISRLQQRVNELHAQEVVILLGMAADLTETAEDETKVLSAIDAAMQGTTVVQGPSIQEIYQEFLYKSRRDKYDMERGAAMTDNEKE